MEKGLILKCLLANGGLIEGGLIEGGLKRGA